ncbi:MAG: ComF family protein [Acidobacteriota bacterium]|nr:ComF family protein [Acidobacteriota bacterium]
MIWRTFANTLLSSLFEPPCAACARVLAHPLNGAVCEQCWGSIRTGAPLTEHPRGHAVQWACAVDHYEGRLRDIIHALKYERRRSIAKPLGRLMRERGQALLLGADLVVPVPLHPRRERDRGFNQADDLARQLGLPVAALLRRVRDTTSQIELPADARHQNVRDAFALAHGPAKAGRHMATVVVLVDDVSTTGATLEACARVLKRGGVREVRALTAARVVTGRR